MKNIPTQINLFTALLPLAILGVFLQNAILGVNFPEDRASIVYIVILVGALAHWVDTKHLAKVLLLLPTYFLADFIASANTSHFRLWWMEHISSDMLTKVEEINQPYPASFSSAGIMNSIWCYHGLYKKPTNMPCMVDYPSTWSDVLLVASQDTGDVKMAEYKRIDFDPISQLHLLQKSPALIERPFADTLFQNLALPHQYYTVIQMPIEHLKGKGMALYADWVLNTTPTIAHLYIHFGYLNESGQQISSSRFEFDFAKENWDTKPNHRTKIFLPEITEDAKEVQVFLFNPLVENVRFESINFKLVELEQPLQPVKKMNRIGHE